MDLLGRYSNPGDLWPTLERLQALPRGRRSKAPRRAKQVQTRLSPTDVDRLIERYTTGATINDLAAEFSINRTTVMKHIERAGAPRRRGIVQAHIDDARRLYEQGWSLARIGRHLGVDPGTVWYTFNKPGSRHDHAPAADFADMQGADLDGRRTPRSRRWGLSDFLCKRS